jgi:hypothetical protein
LSVFWTFVGRRWLASGQGLSAGVCGAGSEDGEYASFLIVRRTAECHNAMIID